MSLFWLGGNGPKDIPPQVYMQLVTKFGIPADDLAGLRCVQRISFRGNRPLVYFRIYDPNQSDLTRQVRDFNYLDDYPEIVKYEGYWYDVDESIYLKR